MLREVNPILCHLFFSAGSSVRGDTCTRVNAFACAEPSAIDEETLDGAITTFENLLSGAVFYVHKYAYTFIDMSVGIYVCI